MNQTDSTRRRIFKIASALAIVPFIASSANVLAAQNGAMRTGLKYKDTPTGDKKCSNCYHFVPGPDAKSLGGCKMFAGDTEISPEGYCSAWAQKK
ncbi:MAG: hypothetical protein CVU28_14555 [Betaproteobacteria bacterium HGW-Betaproteobacteria-21]|nr:MAG: hypothetical protein CVU28_14555 [Betaproteobacteria bacterium HGW-Betaproteobacteria-21]